MMVMWAEPTSPSLHYYAPHQGFSNTLFEVACGDRRSVRQSEFVFPGLQAGCGRRPMAALTPSSSGCGSSRIRPVAREIRFTCGLSA